MLRCFQGLEQLVKEGGRDVAIARVTPHGEVAEADRQRMGRSLSVEGGVAADVAAAVHRPVHNVQPVFAGIAARATGG